MRVPVRIPVSGKIVRVEYPDYLLDDDGESHISGDCDALNGVIRVSKTQHKDSDALFATLFHELLHMAFHVSGHGELVGEKQEEGIVYAIEHSLAPVLAIKRIPGVRYKEVEFQWEEE